MLTVYTFGDSILDCSHCNDKGVDPARLLVNNHDQLFPEFQGKDLGSRIEDTVVELRAYDGSVIDDLMSQIEDLEPDEPCIALVTVGGYDLIQTLVKDEGPGFESFALKLDAFLEALPIRPVLLATIYDATFGAESSDVYGVDPLVARHKIERINTILRHFGNLHGAVVDLHAHFLKGKPEWCSPV